jgi:CheY-like chemotaxis protein
MASSVPTKPATVLIVENEAIVRIELAGRLTEMGWSVLAAANADEAIVLLDSHPEIVLLFTDIRMPGSMDGLRLAHHVRDRWPPVKIIVTSGLSSAQLGEMPIDSLFLAKPYWPDALADALAHMLSGGGPRATGPQATFRA